MNFLEKDLETIVWENYLACAERGLVIDQAFFQVGKHYRQMNLMPYGIADLVNIRFSGPDNLYFVQVIELKKGKVDMAAYLQAKRYQTAIFEVLDQLRKSEGLDYKIILSSVLIGNEVETAGDFIFCLNSDYSCTAYTYSYGFAGIEFKSVGRDWRINGADASVQLHSFGGGLLEHREEAVEHYANHRQRLDMDHQQLVYQTGDWNKALLVTADGVLMNEDLLSLPEPEEDGDDN